MHHCAIEDPSNVVILNINGLELTQVKILFAKLSFQKKSI
jgi:hypothetical protein